MRTFLQYLIESPKNSFYNRVKNYKLVFLIKKENKQLFGPILSSTCSELIDRYAILKPDHSFYREATWEKFFAGFGVGYLLLRELPVRNFYARCFIMYVYLAKVLDHF